MPPRRRLTGASGGVSSSAAKFSPAEIRRLEKLLGDTIDDVLDERLHQTLADEFNAVRDRRSKELTADGLRRWFVRRIGDPEGSDTVPIRDRSSVAGPHLTLAEIQKLEKLVADTRDDLFDEQFHQKLADGFNAARDRRFMELTAESLRGWFVRRIGEPKGLDTIMDSAPSGDVRDAGLPKALDAVMDSAPSGDVRDAGLPKGLDTVIDSAPSGDARDAGLPKELDTIMDSAPLGDVRDAGLPNGLDTVMDSAPSGDVRDAGLPKGLDTIMDSAPSGDVRDAGLPKSSPQCSSETTKVSIFNSISNHNSAPNWKLTAPPNPVATMLPRRSGAHFSPAEKRELEKLIDDTKDDLFDGRLHQRLVDEFNAVRDRRSKRLTTEDLREWFFRRKGELKGSDTVANSTPLGDVGLLKSAAKTSSETTKGEKIPQVAEWEFEARSSNGAWYDVDTFVSHRNINGNLEACVRYQGFGNEDNEWVIVKDAVRLRSISLESSECLRVGVGDLVVCFRETSKVSAAHYDAHVLEIERKLHDCRGCRCQFLIRYINDQTEEKVPLRRLCVRPPPDVNFFRDAVSFFL